MNKGKQQVESIEGKCKHIKKILEELKTSLMDNQNFGVKSNIKSLEEDVDDIEYHLSFFKTDY